LSPRTGSTRRIQVRWLLAGVIVWLVLASSITLEQGQEVAAEWGTGAALAMTGLLILAIATRVAWKALRGSVRRIHCWVGSRFR
jgi:hypothetical protein